MSQLDPQQAERWLALVMRLSGAILVLAFAAVLLPPAWMAWSHEKLGFGPLPETPVFEYLARSISLLYGCRGVAYLLLARDIRRYLPVIALFGWLDLVFGVAMLGIDLHAGMPWWWTAFEGPGLFVVGIITLSLVFRVRAAQAADPSAT
ncbi:MAG: hypothetical protein AAGD38_20410 [Acidobacteriota bacterium]